MFYKSIQWLYEASHGDWWFPYELSNINHFTFLLRLRAFYLDPENPLMKKGDKNETKK